MTGSRVFRQTACMPRFAVPKNAWREVEHDGKKYHVLSKQVFDSFNIGVLGLGNVSAPSTPIDAIAAVFDLAGFTNFCKQIEPQLSVPHFLNAFLKWLLAELREEMIEAELKEGMQLWCPLPFFVKFLGDGLLVLWNSEEMNDPARRNVVLEMWNICAQYENEFLPMLKRRIVEPPPRLRCGLARGTVFSIGEGEDYVGSCINMAARVQELPGITFCFNRRGFEVEAADAAQFFTECLVVKQITIRGIGEQELVCLLREQAEALSRKDRKIYKDPSD